jgi:puromycin-sensitive aminopeptidase
MLRSLLLTALVRLGHDETVNEGVRRFHIFFEDRKTSLLPPDTRKVVGLLFFLYMPLQNPLMSNMLHSAVMRTVSASNRSGYDALLKIYREAAEPQEKSLVLGLHTFL